MTKQHQISPSRSLKPRGRPFKKGNPGRPRGSRNKTTVALEGMLDDAGEVIIAKLIELAKQGDRGALRLAVDRIMPARSTNSVPFDLPPIRSAADVAAALAAIVAAMGEGKLSPHEGATIAQTLALTLRSFELAVIEQRIEALEQRLEANK